MGIGNFSDRELKIIELRTQGVKTPQIAKTLGIPKNTAYEALWKIYRKVGTGFDRAARRERAWYPWP